MDAFFLCISSTIITATTFFMKSNYCAFNVFLGRLHIFHNFHKLYFNNLNKKCSRHIVWYMLYILYQRRITKIQSEIKICPQFYYTQRKPPVVSLPQNITPRDGEKEESSSLEESNSCYTFNSEYLFKSVPSIQLLLNY